MTRNVSRFLEAQASTDAGYATALAELRNGRKQSHWIWYVFPQLSGLGQSSLARRYSLADREEALAYLANPVLRQRLIEITREVSRQMQRGVPLDDLLGSRLDALKLVSSLTLFQTIASGVDEELSHAAREGLDEAAAQGYPACEFTLTALGRSR